MKCPPAAPTGKFARSTSLDSPTVDRDLGVGSSLDEVAKGAPGQLGGGPTNNLSSGILGSPAPMVHKRANRKTYQSEILGFR
jgi:hypothetical protein